MAVEADQILHPLSVDGLVFVAFEAELLLREELVEDIAMAIGALDLLREDMPCMDVRHIDVGGLRKPLVPVPVALHAELPAHDDLSMPRGHGRRTVENGLDEEHVRLEDREVMAVMAVDRPVLALFPYIEGCLHEVAARAELRVVRGEVEEPERSKAKTHKGNQDNSQDKKGNNELACKGHFLSKFLEPSKRVKHATPPY